MKWIFVIERATNCGIFPFLLNNSIKNIFQFLKYGFNFCYGGIVNHFGLQYFNKMIIIEFKLPLYIINIGYRP